MAKIGLTHIKWRANIAPRSILEHTDREQVPLVVLRALFVKPSLPVSDRHEVSLSRHNAYTRRILDRVAQEAPVSQRSLSQELGIALGLTNLLLRRLAAQGWIRIVRLRPNHARYLITPAGFVQKARLSRDYFLHTVRFYGEARDRVQQQLAQIRHASHATEPASIVLYGAGELAEVGWLCVQRTSLRLIGVVDDSNAGRDFFGCAVQPSSELSGDTCNGVRYDWLISTSLEETSKIRADLARRGVDAAKIVWL
jgi:DNA-binding Lrp family transcriptional regulator